MEHELAEKGARAPRAFVVWATIALAAVFVVGVAAVSRYGGRVAELAELRVAEIALREGQRLERAGYLPQAIAAYRKALALGIDDSASRDDGIRRLSALLAEQGRASAYRERLGTSLVAGGEFDSEVDLGEWSEGDETRSAIAFDGIEKISGRGALRIACSEDPNRLRLIQTVRVVPGKSYEASIWSRTHGTAGGAAFRLTAKLDAAVASDLGVFDLSKDREWRQERFSFVAPESAGAVEAIIEATGATQDSDARVWIDRVLLREAQPSLLVNGSFEYGDDGRMQWLGETEAKIRVSADTDHAVEGRRSLRVELPDSANLGVWQTIDVMPGAAYRLEGWIRTENAGGAGACLEVQDAERGWKAFTVSTAPRITGTQDWQRVSIVFEAPAETHMVSVFVRRPADLSAADNVGTVWFDACHISRAEGTAP